jgi:hypothetical protein
MKIILLLLLFSFSASAQSFSMRHLDCNIRFNETNDFLSRQATGLLAGKGFRAVEFVNGNKMNVGDLYFKLDYQRDPAKMWKDCVVKVSIRKASKQIELSKDRTLYEKSIRRALPRHTFAGNERCKRGLKDAFVHIPQCLRMTVDEKVKGN